MSVGRTDWWKLAEEHTPYELAVLQCYEAVEPFGETRADMRMAVQTGSLLQALAHGKMTEVQMRDCLQRLAGYCRVDKSENVVTPEQAAKMFPV